MLPALARRAIEAYSDPADLVLDPMCGIGTTLVEAIHLDRRAVGVELEERWARLARGNLAHAREEGAAGRAEVIRGDAGDLPRLLTKAPDLLLTSPPYGDAVLGDAGEGGGIAHARASEGRRVSARDRTRARTACRADRYGEAAGNIAHLPYGRVDLVLSSPPYACEVGQLDKRAWGTGRRPLSHEGTQLQRQPRQPRARARTHLPRCDGRDLPCLRRCPEAGRLPRARHEGNALARGSAQPGRGHDRALRGRGLLYWQHVIALLATIRDGELVPRPSFWQRMQIKRALERGERTHLVCHEDVLVFRKPRRGRRGAAASGMGARRTT